MYKQLLIIIAIIINGHSCIDSSQTKSLLPRSNELQPLTGDCYSFKDSTNNYFIAVIMSVHKSSKGHWYALCFTDYYDTVPPDQNSLSKIKFSGRKVMYFKPGRYTIGFDIDWIRDTIIDKQIRGIVGNINLDGLAEIEFGSEAYPRNYSEFLYSFQFSKMARSTPPDRYDDLTKLHLRSEEYFTLREIYEWYTSFKKPY